MARPTMELGKSGIFLPRWTANILTSLRRLDAALDIASA